MTAVPVLISEAGDGIAVCECKTHTPAPRHNDLTCPLCGCHAKLNAEQCGKRNTHSVTHQKDVELVERLKQRDETALSTLYDRYATPTYSVAYRVLGNHEAAEEIVQDLFLFFWNRPSAWDPSKGRLINWLLAVVRNRSIDRLRRDRLPLETNETPLDDLTHYLAAPSAEPRWEDRQVLRDLMRRLPEEQMVLIELAFFKGMTHSGIAAKLQLPLGTVKTRLRTGIQRLRVLWFEEVQAEGESERD